MARAPGANCLILRGFFDNGEAQRHAGGRHLVQTGCPGRRRLGFPGVAHGMDRLFRPDALHLSRLSGFCSDRAGGCRGLCRRLRCRGLNRFQIDTAMITRSAIAAPCFRRGTQTQTRRPGCHKGSIRKLHSDFPLLVGPACVERALPRDPSADRFEGAQRLQRCGLNVVISVSFPGEVTLGKQQLAALQQRFLEGPSR